MINKKTWEVVTTASKDLEILFELVKAHMATRLNEEDRKALLDVACETPRQRARFTRAYVQKRMLSPDGAARFAPKRRRSAAKRATQGD
jgi:hypothetical protein